MDITITPGKLCGINRTIPSKSFAHRYLICAAFSHCATKINCPQTNNDIEATADCLRSLGAQITYENGVYTVLPVENIPAKADLYCKESGSTLRFLLPICGALGIDATFHLEGRLPNRPLSPLWEELNRMGCALLRPTETTVNICGKLKAGRYIIDGGISSQFITGLLFALAMIDGESELVITGNLQSKPYVDITKTVLTAFEIKSNVEKISGTLPFHSPGNITVEGDWSNGAFFICASAIGNEVTVSGLNRNSCQGDIQVMQVIEKLKTNCATVSGSDIPDLIPILAVTAGALHGATFTDVARLRLKESDRIDSVCQMLRQFGIQTKSDENTLTVYPGKFRSCIVDSCGDHRIAMSAAIAATVADGPVTILNAQCVEKSYPGFWDAYGKLGGIYE